MNHPPSQPSHPHMSGNTNSEPNTPTKDWGGRCGRVEEESTKRRENARRSRVAKRSEVERKGEERERCGLQQATTDQSSRALAVVAHSCFTLLSIPIPLFLPRFPTVSSEIYQRRARALSSLSVLLPSSLLLSVLNY